VYAVTFNDQVPGFSLTIAINSRYW
jgi:hypothetical protein